MTILACIEEGCDRKVLARKMCSTHYSYWHRASKGRADKAHEKDCTHCGTPFKTTTRKTQYCSLSCAQRARAGYSTSTVVALYAKARTFHGHVLQPRKGTPLVMGQCAYCPKSFVGYGGSVYCSTDCSNRASWKRLYDKRGEFKVTDKVRSAIYERDSYTCQLCSESVDASLHYTDVMSATLDHIIPQSLMAAPDHTPGNLRMAHRICNSVRGNRV